MKTNTAILLIFLTASCQKSSTEVATPKSTQSPTNNDQYGVVAAKINDRQWRSAANKAAGSNEYLAAMNSGKLQIKTFGSFADSSGNQTDDQLGIYMEGVTDTGVYMLKTSNYVVYSQLSNQPKYFSSQLSNIGKVHITNLTDTSITGSFECSVESTNGEGSLLIKEGSFLDVRFQ